MPGEPAPILPSSRWRRVLARLIVFFLVYGAIEFIASRMERIAPVPERVAWAVGVIRRGGDPFRYYPHPYALYQPAPNHVGWSGRLEHDALGFRGRAVAVPKPPGTWRLVCLGDSTTYGTLVDDPDQSYPAQLEAFLRRETGHPAIEVVNAGFPGATSAEVLQTLVFRVWPLEPDAVVLNAGLNDLVALLGPGCRDDYAHVRRRFVLPHYSAATRTLLRSPAYRTVFERLILPSEMFWGWVVDPGPEADWRLREPVAYAANTESAVLVARIRGARPLLVTPRLNRRDAVVTPAWEEVWRRLSAAAGEVSLRHGVPLCRFHERSLPDDVWGDAVHLDARGERLKAEFVGRDVIRYGLIPLPSGEVLSAHGQG